MPAPETPHRKLPWPRSARSNTVYTHTRTGRNHQEADPQLIEPPGMDCVTRTHCPYLVPFAPFPRAKNASLCVTSPLACLMSESGVDSRLQTINLDTRPSWDFVRLSCQPGRMDFQEGHHLTRTYSRTSTGLPHCPICTSWASRVICACAITGLGLARVSLVAPEQHDQRGLGP